MMWLDSRSVVPSAKYSSASDPSHSFLSSIILIKTVYTLSTFSSLLLVTVTVTRKMLTMILSVVWFGHSLGTKQWAGVGLVFGGIGAEGIITRMEKSAKEKAKLTKPEGKKEL